MNCEEMNHAISQWLKVCQSAYDNIFRIRNRLNSKFFPLHFILTPICQIIILTVNEIYREYCASRSRKAANFLMRMCASHYTERSVFLAASITVLYFLMAICCKSNSISFFSHSGSSKSFLSKISRISFANAAVICAYVPRKFILFLILYCKLPS